MDYDSVKEGGYTLAAAGFAVGLKWIEVFILQPPAAESIYAIQYELFIVAFSICWSVYRSAPDEYVRWVVRPMLAVGVGLFISWILSALASPVEGLPPPVGWSFARNNYEWFTFLVPDVLALVVLLWAVVAVRRIRLEG